MAPSFGPCVLAERIVDIDHQDVATQLPQRFADRLGEFTVGEQHLRLAMLQAIGQRAGVEPGIQRVQHGPRHRHAEMRLVHFRRVGGHHRHRLAALDARTDERRGKAAAAGVCLAPGVAARTVHHRRPVREDQRGAGDEAQRRQRLIIGRRLVEIGLEGVCCQYGGVGRHSRVLHLRCSAASKRQDGRPSNIPVALPLRSGWRPCRPMVYPEDGSA